MLSAPPIDDRATHDNAIVNNVACLMYLLWLLIEVLRWMHLWSRCHASSSPAVPCRTSDSAAPNENTAEPPLCKVIAAPNARGPTANSRASVNTLWPGAAKAAMPGCGATLVLLIGRCRAFRERPGVVRKPERQQPCVLAGCPKGSLLRIEVH